jgi:choline kinase
MRGIILAAGKGSRLNGTAGDKPKCLVEVGGTTLLERQIQTLHLAGIHDIVVVVGCQADRVRSRCGHSVTYIENSRYAETNSMYSLWMARALLYEGFVVLNCDVLCHPVLLLDLLSSRHPDALLMAYHPPNQAPLGDEEMKVKVRRGRVVDMSKTMDPAEADGENVGIVKFSASGASSLVEIMDGLVEAGDVKAWAPRAFLEFSRTTPLFALGTRGFPWIEIDFPEDYRRAIREILPELDADGLENDGDRYRSPRTLPPLSPADAR